MTKEDQGQLYCIGFAAFAQKYRSEADFKKWFEPIETSIDLLVEGLANNKPEADYRLRRL